MKTAYGKISSEIGHATILVANAGFLRGRKILDASEHDLRKTFEINVFGVLYCIKLVLPHMIKADYGHVLITSSVTSYLTLAGVTDYSASKAAVSSIIDGLHTELKHHHGNPAVKVSAILPGTIATRMFKGVSTEQNSALLPVLEPAEVAGHMLRILSSGQRYVIFYLGTRVNKIMQPLLTTIALPFFTASLLSCQDSPLYSSCFSQHQFGSESLFKISQLI